MLVGEGEMRGLESGFCRGVGLRGRRGRGDKNSQEKSFDTTIRSSISRIMLAIQLLHPRQVTLCFQSADNRRRKKKREKRRFHSQSADQKQARYDHFLRPLQLQIPDNVQRQAQNDNIKNQIRHQDGRHESLD